MIWFVIITVIVIVFYGIISIGTSRKSVSMESENEEELSIPLSITVTSLSEKNNPSEPLDNDNESSKMKKCMTQKNNVMIRKAERQDVSLLLEFIKGIAKYEKMENEVVATPEVLEQEMFDEHRAEAVFAVVDGRKVGFALYFYNFSTFIGHSGLYLEDLFVWPEDRGQGYGKALLLHLVKIAREHHCGRMEWSCLNWNQPSIDFYLSLGAVPMKEWTVYRLDAAALERLS
jgi:GNAT superfamily N-acetyltransferase